MRAMVSKLCDTWIDEAWTQLILKYCHLSMNDSHTFPNNKESLK
jgi:hypothetical protein